MRCTVFAAEQESARVNLKTRRLFRFMRGLGFIERQMLQGAYSRRSNCA